MFPLNMAAFEEGQKAVMALSQQFGLGGKNEKQPECRQSDL